jgi:hypothetical protein
VVVAALNALGGLVIGFAWYQGSGEARTGDMLDWLNVGIAGLIVLGAANALHVLRGRRTVTAVRVDLLGQVPRFTGTRSLPPEVRPEEGASLPVDVVVAAEGMSHYHLPGCPLAVGKPTARGSQAEFAQAGLTACEVCEP